MLSEIFKSIHLKNIWPVKTNWYWSWLIRIIMIGWVKSTFLNISKEHFCILLVKTNKSRSMYGLKNDHRPITRPYRGGGGYNSGLPTNLFLSSFQCSSLSNETAASVQEMMETLIETPLLRQPFNIWQSALMAHTFLIDSFIMWMSYLLLLNSL